MWTMFRARRKKKPSPTLNSLGAAPPLSEVPKKPSRLSTKLKGFQENAAHFAVDRGNVALFFPQRTGKTITTLRVIELLMEPQFAGLLVVPLTNIDSTWRARLSSEFPELAICNEWDEFKKAPFPKVLLVHYESLSPRRKRRTNFDVKTPPAKKGVIHYACKFKWSLVVFDESQRLNNRNSGWSKAARRLRHNQRKIILSGTPIEQAPQDVWAELRFVAPECLGDTWTDFKLEFLRPTGWMGKKLEFRMEKFDEFMERIRPVALRVSKDDAGILEPNIHWERVSLFGEQARLYNELEAEMVTTINGRRVTSKLSVTTMGKLQQIASGFVIDDDGEIHRIGNAKLRRLKTILKRLKPPVVVFCRYREEVRMLSEVASEFSDRVEQLWGETGKGKHKGRVRGELNQRFQAGAIDYLIAQVRTGGVGSDLYAAKSLVFYSTTFSFIDFDQACARADLMDKECATDIYLIFAGGTVDEDTFQAVVCKRDVSEMVLKRLGGERR